MLRTPTEFELDKLMHAYDPVKAHEYYERNKKLKGRKKGGSGGGETNYATGPALPKTPRVKVKQVPLKKPSAAKARQRKELQAAIRNLEVKLEKLVELIRKKEHAEASEDRKGKAKKERAAKEKDKPKSAAEKAKANREAEKYRDKHKQELATKAKNRDSSSSTGGSSSKSESKKETSVSDLKALATRVRGQIATAKVKLAAL